MTPTSPCEPWTGPTNGRGLPIHRHRSVRRARYEDHHGPVHRSWFVVPTCDTPLCVALAHLKAVHRRDLITPKLTTPAMRRHLRRTNPRRKLTPADIADIKRVHEPGTRDRPGSTVQLAARYGVHRHTIIRAVRR